MGDGFWSPTAVEGGEWHGVPRIGCWFRKNGGPAYWMSGGPHQLWNAIGAEGGLLGFPTSMFDPYTGVQLFEHGAVWWDGDEWKSGKTPEGAKPVEFHIPAAPAPPLG